MKRIYLYSLILVLLVMDSSCNDSCNDCLDLTTKDLLYVDEDNNNLLFGQNAQFDPDQVTITGPEGETYPVLQLEESGTLQFSIEPGVATYRVQITESMIDVLSFDLSERESELCCGQQTFSTATQLNGQEIDNSDLITIIQ